MTLTVGMQAAARDWLEHPLTRSLKQILQDRQARLVGEIFSGRPVDPIRQGQGVANQFLLQLLDLSPEQLMEVFHKELR